MFDGVITALRGLFQGLWDALSRVTVNVWGFILAAAGIIASLIEAANDWVGNAAAWIASVALPAIGFTMPAEVASICGLANRMFPLTELCVMLVAWGTLCAILMCYHVVKSWLWGVSGS